MAFGKMTVQTLERSANIASTGVNWIARIIGAVILVIWIVGGFFFWNNYNNANKMMKSVEAEVKTIAERGGVLMDIEGAANAFYGPCTRRSPVETLHRRSLRQSSCACMADEISIRGLAASAEDFAFAAAALDALFIERDEGKVTQAVIRARRAAAEAHGRSVADSQSMVRGLNAAARACDTRLANGEFALTRANGAFAFR